MARARTRSIAGLAVDRIRQDRGLGLLTALAMAAFVVGIYAVIVLGAGMVLGTSGAPSLWLSVLATAIVALAFEPVRRSVKTFLARALHQDRVAPYQVLARFPTTVTGSFPAAELPLRMAAVLAEGTAAQQAEVWLTVHGRLELAAVWPPRSDQYPAGDKYPAADKPPPDAVSMPITACAATAPVLGLDRPGAAPRIVDEGRRRSLPVRERGELLGALTVVLREGQELTPVEERLFAGLAAQSGLTLRVAGLRTELEQQLDGLHRRSADLRAARRDLVDRQDAERKRLERNIHDGAQQEVIALLVNLRLAQTLLRRSPERGATLLAEQAAAARATIETLTALSRGLYPRLLTDAGPVAALAAAVASGPIPVELTSGDLPRCTPAVEAAVYFCALEAVQNATKHSAATRITIDIRRRNGTGPIELTVTDDGRGFTLDRPTTGGLANIRDRIESVQGTVSVLANVPSGTTVRALIPIAQGA